MGQKTTRDVEPQQKKLDLSAAQVAGSSLATVAAALLASKLGVYGTIAGAGVVSVVATAGGPVIQHFFRRTGDHLRETAVRPKPRQAPVPQEAGSPEPSREFGAATVHGTRVRGWKRTAVASGAAFALAIGGLGTYEAMAGTSVSADGRTLLTGGAATAPDHRREPANEKGGGGKPSQSEEPGPSGNGGQSGQRPGPGASPDPSSDPSSSPSGDRGPAPDPSRSAPVDPTPAPSPSKHTPTPAPTPTPHPDGPTRAGGATGAGPEQRSAP
ncbi:hypothetical protein [Streptomyces sp. NPDC002990]